MLQSKLFTKTKKEAPKDEVSKNAILLSRAGYIHKEMAGVYSFLPLGLRVINKLKKIITDEMNGLGSHELIMSTLQDKEIWKITDRWDDEKVDVWFKSELKNGNEVGFGWSHEEPITNMVKSFVSSYQDLPIYVHQYQNKLRNETRAKSGIMRCREFIMKDMYSYCMTEKQHMDFYQKTTEAYMNVYKKVGLGNITYVTSASGGVFTDKFSHELQTICETGEDIIHIHKKDNYAVNNEIFNEETLKKMGVGKDEFDSKNAAEVGNIFTFGTKKCEQMGLYYTSEAGEKIPVFLGSYGIGVTRLMGVLVEALSDEKGIVWPTTVAPFAVHLLHLGEKGGKSEKEAENLYRHLEERKIEVLYDDRDVRAGEKFADSDLLGMPLRVVVSDKTVDQGKIEIKARLEKESKLITSAELFSHLEKHV